MTTKKRPREAKGLPLVKAPRPNRIVKLKEEWIKPHDLKPTVYIGPEYNISKLLKFLSGRGMNAEQKSALTKGLAVSMSFGEGTRILQLVNPESKSGTFEYGPDELQLMDVGGHNDPDPGSGNRKA